jgi:hypothetical protein
VRSGAVARGEFADEGSVELPDSYRVAGPGCYAFQPTQPVTCATTPQTDGSTIVLTTRAGEYPVWGHLTFGLASRLPGLAPIWWARLAGAAVATALVTAALFVASSRHRPHNRLLTAAVVLGITPMAWSTFGTVNPSSFVIAGAVALWAGLLASPPRVASMGMVTAIGWAATALPRRDGLIWACLALIIALAATDRSVADWWRSLPIGARTIVAASTSLAVLWGVTSDDRSSQMVVLAPIAVAVADLARRWWEHQREPRHRRMAAASAAVVSMAMLVLLLRARPGGWDTDLAVDVIAQTDENLIESIGVLGWLDTSIPWFATIAWIAVIVFLATVSFLADSRSLVWAGVLVAGTVLTSWVFELYQGNTSGTYWQGRYSLPLLVGLPILLVHGIGRSTAVSARHLERVTSVAIVGSLVIANVAAWAAARRFGVGTLGSHLPWRWDTPIQPVPPLVLLAVHALATGGLALVLLRRAGSPRPLDAAR